MIYISKKRNKLNSQPTSAYSPDAFIKNDESADADSDDNILGGFSINLDDLDTISDKDTDSIFSGFFK
ncbi:hypothetical protein SDC9_163363 [bioreactor metagenome]|uniref:Uncharacterized protein n=1 Tax=bioreactor metagenome TaxID=1076179 RepID=A0A645FNM9_9ZZZZ